MLVDIPNAELVWVLYGKNHPPITLDIIMEIRNIECRRITGAGTKIKMQSSQESRIFYYDTFNDIGRIFTFVGCSC